MSLATHKTLPHTEQVTNANISQDNQTATTCALYDPTSKQHIDVLAQRRNE